MMKTTRIVPSLLSTVSSFTPTWKPTLTTTTRTSTSTTSRFGIGTNGLSSTTCRTRSTGSRKIPLQRNGIRNVLDNRRILDVPSRSARPAFVMSMSSSSASSSSSTSNANDITVTNNTDSRPTGNRKVKNGGTKEKIRMMAVDDAIGGVPFPNNFTNGGGGGGGMTSMQMSKKSKGSKRQSGQKRSLTALGDDRQNENEYNDTNQTDTSSSSSSSSTTNTDTDTQNSNSNAFDANSVLAIDPRDINIVAVADEEKFTSDCSSSGTNDTVLVTGSPATVTSSNTMTKIQNGIQSLSFVDMFRGSANYIANHRNTIAVYHIPGGIVDPEFGINEKASDGNTVFGALMNDIALTWLLGMKIVIVAGCRHQIEKRTQTPYNPYGIRVTDEQTLRIIKEEAGLVRFEVERQLARSLRLQGNMNSPGSQSGSTGSATDGFVMTLPVNARPPTSPPGVVSSANMGAFDGNVVSGNFYSAQPFGILDGVDYKYTGFVRRVEVEKIRRLHEQRDICLLTSLGVSPSGEVFNVNSECLAASVAGALGASKVIYFTEQEIELRHSVHKNKINSLRNYDARNLLTYYNMKTYAKGFVENTIDTSNDSSINETQPPLVTTTTTTTSETDSVVPTSGRIQTDVLLKIGWCTEAIALGVKRAHIISPKHGALLQELYTRDGSGTLICADLYEGIRRADITDVVGIHELISPLIRLGTLIDRPIAQLEKEVDTYYVYTRDKTIVACGQLKKFENGFAEIGCLVVNKEFRSRGRGDAMLGYLERLCLKNGCNQIFVLSTQTMEWFVERGFKIATVDDLPPSRQATYNYKRNSKIYLKIIENDRDLDASELWWNR